MTFDMKIREERAEAWKESRITEIFTSVSEGDYPSARGAEKLGISEEQFLKEMAAAGYTVPTASQ